MVWLFILLGIFLGFLLIVIFAVVIVRGNDSSDNFNFDPISKKCERRGAQGENCANYHLHHLLMEDEYLLTNLLLPLRNGYTTEIDSILITRKGIFCIEIKNWVGHISGNDQDDYWIQKYDNPYRKDKHHRNPVKQNESHYRVLERLLGYCYEIKNVIIFPRIEGRRHLNSAFVYEIKDFIVYYEVLPNNKIDEAGLKEIADKLKIYQATPEELRIHREQIKTKYTNKY